VIARVLVSTASQQTWVVNTEACEAQYTDPANNSVVTKLDSDCEDSRGRVFNTTESSSWKTQGFYELWVGQGLGILGNGFYGYDTVRLGIEGEEGPTVNDTIIGTIRSANFWLGHLGLHPKTTNFSEALGPVPSYITRLFEQGSIPSLSFGYTAGAQYRKSSWNRFMVYVLNKPDEGTFLGSLTLGGYDSSRYISNNLSFVFAPNNEQDLTVGLAGLTASTTTRPNIELLEQTDVTMYIDSTVAEIWLPEEICKAFEEAFGLTYDNTTNLYLVDDLLHQTLKAQNPNITFTFNQPYTSNETVQITLPYGAFDLDAKPPYRGLNESTKYFPLRRGTDKNQWILGRAFLQEAYISVDWERARFSVYQCDWKYGKPAQVIPIVSPMYAKVLDTSKKTTGLSTGTVAGIAIGSVSTVMLVVTVIAWWFWRRRRNAVQAKYTAGVARKGSSASTAPSSPVSEKGPNIFPKAELPGESNVSQHELSTEEKEKGVDNVAEIDNTERPIYEMLGDIPVTQEAGGRQLSEKEGMMVRARNINGVDPNAGSEPVSMNGYTRAAPVASLEDVAMLDDRLANSGVSPVTPRAPRDGALLEAGDTFFLGPPPYGRGGHSVEEFLSPISPLDAPTCTDASRRRFSYES
jgi:hypothetical protein